MSERDDSRHTQVGRHHIPQRCIFDVSVGGFLLGHDVMYLRFEMWEVPLCVFTAPKRRGERGGSYLRTAPGFEMFRLALLYFILL